MFQPLRPLTSFVGVASLIIVPIGIASLRLSSSAIAQTPDAIPTTAIAQSSTPSALPSPATNPNVSFRRPLRVERVHISNRFEQRRSEYQFTIDFPADAVEPLEKMVFQQVEGAGYPRYRDSGNYAFDGTNRTPLPLSAVENNDDDRVITVKFDPPVEPGRQVTIAFKARNPRSGIYTYQLTAFPVGATEGQYAGVESLTFYDPSRRRFRY